MKILVIVDLCTRDSGCPQMFVRYYLPLRHDLVAKSLLKSLILKQNPLDKYKHQKEPEYVYNVGNVEYWWNLSIQTTTKLPHNKPDIVIMEQGTKNLQHCRNKLSC